MRMSQNVAYIEDRLDTGWCGTAARFAALDAPHSRRLPLRAPRTAFRSPTVPLNHRDRCAIALRTPLNALLTRLAGRRMNKMPTTD